MLVSLSWLKKYVKVPDDTVQFVEDLTMAGLNVEGVTKHGFSDPNVVIGKVLESERHPNADKLTLCQVDVGEGDPRQIVCGAPNVAAGQTVLVALPGANLPGDLKIRKSKIRGEVSMGMICSERELGLGDDAAGIMVLDDDHQPGAPMTEVLPDSDEILEIEVTPNRPDQLSHIGIAREVAAIYEVPLELPDDTQRGDDKGKPDFKIEIDDAEDCRRYVGIRVSGVRVGPSPPWLVAALESVGLNSVSNIVDVTNYVLMELGQPIHAFDFKTLKGSQIVVRRAEKGDKILALDARTYELNDDVLAICDNRGPVALAGVIGGEETAVHDDTTEVLIESANFKPQLVRRARTRLGISTDASYRFERGADPGMPRMAAERAAALIMEVAGGTIGAVVDEFPNRPEPVAVDIRSEATRRLLGSSLTAEEIEGLLTRLGFEVKERGEESVSVTAPSYRLDVHEEADLIEEVGRLYGYNRIGSGWSYRCTTFAESEPLDAFGESLSTNMVARGFSEVVASSFTDGNELKDFGWEPNDPRRQPMPLRNPLNANHRFMRTSLIPGMLDIVRYNMDRGMRSAKIYQLGRVFLSTEDHEQLPDERLMLAVVVTRPDSQDFWNDSNRAADVFDIKREVEIALRSFDVDLGSDVDYTFDESTGRFCYQVHERVLIEGGVVPGAVAMRYDFEQPVWHVTLDIARLYRRVSRKAKFKKLTDYPSSKRDLSLVASQGTRFEEIEKSLVKSGGRLLESLQVFDVYSGENVEAGHTAYGVRLGFRSAERTLTDEEVDSVIDKILTKLKNQLGVELRS
jgi:phenylalanyl-tRNA synthetase beta chain